MQTKFTNQEAFELNQKLQEYKKLKNSTDKLWGELYPKIKEKCLDILRWENKFLNAGRDMDDPCSWYSYEFEIGIDSIIVSADVSWPYGGHDMWTANIPLTHLFSDDWKEEALEKYEQDEKLKRSHKLQLEEEKGRKLYETLKARFEPESPEEADNCPMTR